MKRTSLRACFCGLAATLILAPTAPLSAQSVFDGGWNVIIVTEAGTCDATYRYPIQITNGAVLYDTAEGSGVVQISGKVEANGQVKVTLQRGDQSAVGAGKLSPSGGGGTWIGESATQGCSGHWEAKRN